MKIFLVFFFYFSIINSSTVYSQDYKLFQADSLRLYMNPTNGYLDGLFIDSVAPSGQDTFYFNFGVINVEMCGQIDYPIFIGKKVLVKSNGHSILFNNNRDSIIIYTLANQGDVWEMYHYVGGNKILAEVIDTDTMTILNNLDSVKIISLQVVDSLGNSVTSSLNNQTVELSRDHGIHKSAYFPQFPDTFLSFKLENKRMMTRRDHSNVSIGDTIQSITTCHYGSISFPPTYSTMIVCDLYYSPAQDTMFISSDCSGNYGFGTNLDAQVVPGFPGRIRNNLPHFYIIHYDSSCGDPLLVVRDIEYSNVFKTGDDSCYFFFFEPGAEAYAYVEKTGLVLYYFSDPRVSPPYYDCYTSLSFYNRVSNGCGNFHNPTSDIEEVNKDNADQPFIVISPNPVFDHLKLLRKPSASSAMQLHIRIYDQTGRLMVEQKMSKNQTEFQINLSSYPEGLYYFSAISSHNNFQSGHFLKMNY